MLKYIYILMLVVGMTGSYSVAYAGVAFTIDCHVTVKCACESENHMRVVPCPDDFVLYEDDEDIINCREEEENIPEGSCEVDCGPRLEAFCSEIPIECEMDEKPNCLATLPVEVELEEGERISMGSSCSLAAANSVNRTSALLGLFVYLM